MIRNTLVHIDFQRKKIENLLRKEFSEEETENIFSEINELVDLEIKNEQECNR